MRAPSSAIRVASGSGCSSSAAISVDVDPFEHDPLVPGCERDSFDVGRERDPVDARRHQNQRLRRNSQSWKTVVPTIRPQENS